MIQLGRTDLRVFPLCLGGNVFGWTADEAASFAVLDAYVEAGGNFIDTADVYSLWAPGHVGGESERVLGRWMKARGNRDAIVLATKVAKWPARPGLSAANIRAAIDGSLERLQTDRVDLYYAHEDDPSVPLVETLGAFDALVRSGKVRHIAASNFDAARLDEALATSHREGLAAYVALQPYYNLVHRDEYEGALAEVVLRHGLACVPYFALERGFLTGKYRPGVEVDSPRAPEAGRPLTTEAGRTTLAALDEIAAAHATTVAAVALAWLRDRPTVVAPIASARSPEQLRDLLPIATLKLTAAERERLDRVGRVHES